MIKAKSPRNRTISITSKEIDKYSKKLLRPKTKLSILDIRNTTIHQNLFETYKYLPENFVDLLFIDPPYNMDKDFNTVSFYEMHPSLYEKWVESWLIPLKMTLKETASIYICSDWKSSPLLYNVLSRHFYVRNRITWERDKGRGIGTNWKNVIEDIWYCTVSNSYTFNSETVKIKKKINGYYNDSQGRPRDYLIENDGKYRVTYHSNIWTDLAIPYWSMKENTIHPTQKPEKLMAKIILASSNKGDFVFDPFLGTGATSVVAKKLGRNYLGVEKDLLYCSIAEKRLKIAEKDSSIQGYTNGVFWERNSIKDQINDLKRKVRIKEDWYYATLERKI